MPSFGFGWKVLFLVYFVVGVISALLLFATPIHEERIEGKASSFGDCLKLLGKPIVLLSFLGIMCHVGIDVGTNTTAPKLLIERLGMTLNEAAFATSLYFIFRTIGCLTGSFFLRVMNNKTFFVISVVMMALSMLGMLFGTSKAAAVRTRQAERGFGTYDNGSFRRNGVPAVHGICQRRHRTGRSRGCNGRRRGLPVQLYKQSKTLTKSRRGVRRQAAQAGGQAGRMPVRP